MERRKTQPVHTPVATYRLQFNREFTFEHARQLTVYLDELGITDIYASPFLMARPGSLHGYDVTDHSRFNPEIGDEDSFAALSDELKSHGMGLIADVVPNHMCISHRSNTWWWDVLENGPSSQFANSFDIDWHPPKEELANKVLLPVLGDQYGRALESQDIEAVYAESEFRILVYGSPIPLAPRSWTMLLEPALAKLREKLDASHPYVAELESIITALSHFPDRTEQSEERIRERQREKEIVKRRLSELGAASPEALGSITAALAEINGQRGDPRSFDRLEQLLANEAYRLSFWRVAMDEINYRRFFDVNDLAAIRPEVPEVFSAVHTLIFDQVKKGRITGLRVDHPDGLFEPEKYFRYLQDACKAQTAPKANGNGQRAGAGRSFYIVAEKILTGSESLRASWAIDGTTGYDFLNQANGVFVDRRKKKAFQQLYRRFTGSAGTFEELVGDSKRLISQVAMSSELNVLARKLDRISEQHRWSRDFTLESLRDALREVLATFPVYRTYVRSDAQTVDPEDRRQVSVAIREAKRRNPAISESVFDFIQSVLLLEHPEGLDESQRAERQLFALRFQQLSAPVMAKGSEDTAFYRYNCLASLNEVGGQPDRFGVSVAAFHRRNLLRGEQWPNSMNASSTHDTKREEDVRARINVLTEMPGEWYRAIRRWQDVNRRWARKIGGQAAPDANEEYLLYQTLVGTWPMADMSAAQHAAYVERIQAYMQKALHEAKVHSSWINPNQEYEQALEGFIANILNPSAENAFLEDFQKFRIPVAKAGMWNSLSQLLLKIASPGIPDFYQGTELWGFHLVDPDNRGAVDFELRRRILTTLRTNTGDQTAVVSRLARNPCDGAIKLYITSRALRFRKEHRDLFADGLYLPLAPQGNRSDRVIAFARTRGGQSVIALAGRFFLDLCGSYGAPLGEPAWGNTSVTLPKKMDGLSFEDVLTGKKITAEARSGKVTIPLAEAFSHCPVALLFGSAI